MTFVTTNRPFFFTVGALLPSKVCGTGIALVCQTPVDGGDKLRAGSVILFGMLVLAGAVAGSGPGWFC